ncbi:uncharacterized protein [Venturia canescens]|uniref:uncharacterized protein n=1 Tax=Venturia canescens TaxID=32260 RepID=UPI001C9D2DF0|nr:uncharacterized protein LOC122417892 [Venturia canescens]
MFYISATKTKGAATKRGGKKTMITINEKMKNGEEPLTFAQVVGNEEGTTVENRTGAAQLGELQQRQAQVVAVGGNITMGDGTEAGQFELSQQVQIGAVKTITPTEHEIEAELFQQWKLQRSQIQALEKRTPILQHQNEVPLFQQWPQQSQIPAVEKRTPVQHQYEAAPLFQQGPQGQPNGSSLRSKLAVLEGSITALQQALNEEIRKRKKIEDDVLSLQLESKKRHLTGYHRRLGEKIAKVEKEKNRLGASYLNEHNGNNTPGAV